MYYTFTNLETGTVLNFEGLSVRKFTGTLYPIICVDQGLLNNC